MNGQPPGRLGDCSHASQPSNSARTRGSPRGTASAGFTTVSTMRAPAMRRISSWSASLERKCANSPLLDMLEVVGEATDGEPLEADARGQAERVGQDGLPRLLALRGRAGRAGLRVAVFMDP